MHVYITGANGFLGRHLRVRLSALGHSAAFASSREWLNQPALVARDLRNCNAIIHVAGVNRGEDHEVYQGNVDAARTLAEAIRLHGQPIPVVFANSIQSGTDSPYGSGKAQASRMLADAAQAVGTSYVDVLLPNLFGEGGRPFYNSVIATFSHQLANGESPRIHQDRELDLLHGQDAAMSLIEAALGTSGTSDVVRPNGTSATVGQLLEILTEYRDIYSTGIIPSLDNKFRLDLFNTYRSYLFPHAYPFLPTRHADQRGDFYEVVRSHIGTSQTSFSTTQPSVSRGNHYHLSKVERFLVLRGEAIIQLRHILDNDVYVFRVNGDTPAAIDMPTFFAHSITNVGSSELLTLFWTNDLFDPARPDTYPIEVAPKGSNQLDVSNSES